MGTATLLATNVPSPGTQALLYVIALVAFVVAAILAFINPPRIALVLGFIAVGLAFATLVHFMVELALS